MKKSEKTYKKITISDGPEELNGTYMPYEGANNIYKDYHIYKIEEGDNQFLGLINNKWYISDTIRNLLNSKNSIGYSNTEQNNELIDSNWEIYSDEAGKYLVYLNIKVETDPAQPVDDDE